MSEKLKKTKPIDPSPGKSTHTAHTLRTFFQYVGRKKWLLILASLCSILASLLNLVGPELLRRITDLITAGITGQMDLDAVREASILMAVCYLIAFFFSYGEGFCMLGLAQSIAKRMRSDIAGKLNRLPLRYYDTSSNGDILSRVTNDADTIGDNLNQSFSSLAAGVIQLIVVLVLMLMTNVLLTITSVLTSLFGMALISYMMVKTQTFFRAQQKGLGDIDGLVEEIYTAHEVVHSFNGEAEACRRFNVLNNALYDSVWRSQFIMGCAMPVMLFIGNLSYVVICVLGAILVVQGTITFGTIVAFMLYIHLFMQPLQTLATAASHMQKLAAAAERVFHFLEESELPPDPVQPARLNEVRGDVVFDQVCFGYTPDQTVIHNFSAHVLPGQKAAIVGPTGAGKTTLVNLLQHFYELDSGQIRIDGIPIQELTRERLHQLFAMVLQDTWIFEGTIRENIVYNHTGITEERLQEIIEAAGLSSFIAQLPQGLDTLLKDSTSLSVGQRQLLTIARAMVSDAPLLILDEATSSVDTRTELCVQQAMDRLMHNRTSFVIAHRLSTIRNADIIFVLENGDIVESGTHEELMKLHGAYEKLYSSQFETGE